MLRLGGSEILFFMLDISGNPETTDLSRPAPSGISVTERYQTNALCISLTKLFNLKPSSKLCQESPHSLRLQPRPRRPWPLCPGLLCPPRGHPLPRPCLLRPPGHYIQACHRQGGTNSGANQDHQGTFFTLWDQEIVFAIWIQLTNDLSRALSIL